MVSDASAARARGTGRFLEKNPWVAWASSGTAIYAFICNVQLIRRSARGIEVTYKPVTEILILTSSHGRAARLLGTWARMALSAQAV